MNTVNVVLYAVCPAIEEESNWKEIVSDNLKY